LATGSEVKLIVRSQLGLAERLGVKAMDDCGPASVATAATYLGTNTSTKQAHAACAAVGRVDTATGAEGTSAAQVRDAAKLIGLKARIVYDWSQASNEVKQGAALILNIQASQRSVAEPLRSKWQRDYWKKQPLATYGHWVTLTHDGVGWEYACPTMQEGKPGRVATSEQVRLLRDSKGQAGFSTPPAMIIVKRKEA
jgi:transposase